jgi:hypothetical protein
LKISLKVYFIKYFTILFTILFSFHTYAGITVASGVTSITGGRVSPIIHGGIDTPTFATTITSVGVKNSIYYHSGYVLSFHLQKEAGKMWWGNLRGGLGLAAHYAKRGYVDGTANESKADGAFGPSLRVTWEILPFVVIGLEGMYGIRNFNTLLLNTQNIQTLFLGVRF